VDPSITLDGVLQGCLECGVVVVDPKHRVSLINPGARKLLSVPENLPPAAVQLPTPLAALLEDTTHPSQDGVPSQISLETNGNGTLVSLLAEVASLSTNGHEGYRVLTLRGLPPQSPLESKVRHFERLARLGMLSAGLAHELRNAMVALGTMTDLLIEQQEDNELAVTVRRELNRANALAARMLKYARPNPLQRKPISTHEVLDRALQLANSRFKEARTTVTKSLRADPDVISADESHIEQVFLNLLINAADAVDHLGDVNLSTDLVPDHTTGTAVRIAVQDSGMGIAPEALPNLFQPFFTTKRHGTGLGLYLARQIIDEHSGTIQVESSPGRGTCVRVLLPAYQD
jgi:two-component system sensor histidine kinase HydH